MAQFGEPANLGPAGKASAQVAQRVRRFTIALKAWIPHEYVTNPAIYPANLIKRVLEIPFPIRFLRWVSVFKGDNNQGYQGSSRAFSFVSYNWDGKRISRVVFGARAGVSHLIIEARVVLPIVGEVASLKRKFNRQEKNSGAFRQLSPSSFRFTLRSGNPFPLGGARN